jgi:hypothetical protein
MPLFLTNRPNLQLRTTMSESPQSLRALFATAKEQKKVLESSLEPNGESYRNSVLAAIANLEECQKLINQLSLFSSNEFFEDISTTDLQYGVPLNDLRFGD